jgi:hypothetical protein
MIVKRNDASYIGEYNNGEMQGWGRITETSTGLIYEEGRFDKDDLA